MIGGWTSKHRKLAACVLIQGLTTGLCLASELPVDLSKHNIAIHSSFTGSTVVLFGVQTATENEGTSIIAVLSGPTQNLVVRKKGKPLAFGLTDLRQYLKIFLVIMLLRRPVLYRIF